MKKDSLSPRFNSGESFCVAFFKKQPPIQRAERWSPPQRRNILTLPKRHERVNFGEAERGKTHKWGFSLKTTISNQAILDSKRFSIEMPNSL